MTHDPDAHYLKIGEAAELLRVSERFIRQSIKRGDLVAVKIGGVTRIPRSAISAGLPTGPAGEGSLFADAVAHSDAGNVVPFTRGPRGKS